MTEEQTTPEQAFEPFPAVAGVGWYPAVSLAALGAALGATATMAVVYPVFVEGTDYRIVTWWGLLAAAVAITVGLTVVRWSGNDTRGWMRLSAAGLALLLGLAAADMAPYEPLLVGLGAVWAVGAVLHRPYLMDLYPARGRFRVVGLYWAAVGLGGALPLWIAVWREPSWATGAAAGAVIAGLALIASVRIPHAVRETTGIASPTAGWGLRSAWYAAGMGVLIGVGINEFLIVMVEVWDIDTRGRLATLGAIAVALAAVLVFGHWYHRLEEASDERLTDVAGLQMILGALLIAAATFSVTLIGLLLTVVAGAAVLGFAAVVTDTAALRARTTKARRVVAGRQLAALMLGGVVASLVVAGPMSEWTPRSTLMVAIIPMLFIGGLIGLGARKQERTDSESVRQARVQRTAITTESLFTARSLDVAYGSIQVLFDVDFEVRDTEIVALLGTNGAGKTTLLSTIAGLLQPRAGRMVFGGADITDFEATWATELGICHIAGPDSIAPSLTVDENLRMFAYAFKGRDVPIKERTAEAFEVFPRLAERHDQKASTLSGGEKQMLALSKAIIQKPRMLLIDEFSLGLAPRIVADLLPVVQRINDEGTAVVIVEQNVATALSIAERAYVIEKGEILWHGAAAELRADPSRIERMYLTGSAEVT